MTLKSWRQPEVLKDLQDGDKEPELWIAAPHPQKQAGRWDQDLYALF